MSFIRPYARSLEEFECFPRIPEVQPLDDKLWRILAPGHEPSPEEWAYVEQKEAEHGRS